MRETNEVRVHPAWQQLYRRYIGHPFNCSEEDALHLVVYDILESAERFCEFQIKHIDSEGSDALCM